MLSGERVHEVTSFGVEASLLKPYGRRVGFDEVGDFWGPNLGCLGRTLGTCNKERQASNS